MRTLLPDVRALAWLFGLLASLAAYADEVIFSNEYESRFEGFDVSTTRTLTRLDDGTYLFKIESSNFIARLDERSHFRITEDGQYQSIEHRVSRRVLGVRREENTRFDWETGEVTYERRDDRRVLPLLPGYTDRTLYQYLMELDLAQGIDMPSYQVVDRGRLRDFTFERLGEELINVDGQEMLALKLKRVTEDDDRETLVWFAPTLNYRLVQIHHTEDDGAEYSMHIES